MLDLGMGCSTLRRSISAERKDRAVELKPGHLTCEEAFSVQSCESVYIM